jgi:hypothetical protein
LSFGPSRIPRFQVTADTDDAKAQADATQRASILAAVQLTCSLAAVRESQCGGTKNATPACQLAISLTETCMDRKAQTLAKVAGVLEGKIRRKLAIPADLDVPKMYAPHDALVPEFVEFAQVRVQLRAAIDTHTQAANDAAKSANTKALMSSRAARLERAYKNSLGLNVIAAIGWFPFIDAPDIAPTVSKAPINAYAHAFRNLDLGAAVRFYATHAMLVQVRGGNRWDRANAMQGTMLTGESYVGLDLAAIKLLGDGPDSTGFQQGIGGGLSVLAYRCAADGGCSTELELGDPYPKTAALDHRTQLTAFIEWRVRKEFQARIAVDVFVDKVKGQIVGTDAEDSSPRLIHVTPSVSVGASFWGL